MTMAVDAFCIEPIKCGYIAGEEIVQIWGPGKMLLSLGIAFCGAFVSLTTTQLLKYVNNRYWYFVLVCGAGLAVGFNTVWCMHFVGMGAIQLQGGMLSGDHPEIRVTYELSFTILSGLAAWVIASLGLHIVAGRSVENRQKIDKELCIRLGCAALLIATGVCIMHYMGMISCTGHFHMHWRPGVIFASAVIALVASGAGLVILMLLPDTIVTRVVAAVVIAVAVTGMHYTGMAAAKYYVSEETLSFLPNANAQVVDFRYVGMVGLLLDLVVYATCIQYGDSLRAATASKEEAARQQKVRDAVATVTELSHPYIVVPATYFLELTLESFASMHEGHRRNLLFLDTLADVEKVKHNGAEIIFFSYECLRFGEVGPDQIQLTCMKDSLREIAQTKNVCLSNMFVWIDCISVPQKNKAMTKAAVNAIYTFASLPTLMIIVCPISRHMGKGEQSDEHSIKKRLWCRVEHLSFGCRRGPSNMRLHRGHVLEPLPEDWMESICVVFDSDSTCCRTKHTMSPVCDRETVVQPLLALYYEQQLSTPLAKDTPDEARSLAQDLLDKHKERMFPTTFRYETSDHVILDKPLFGTMLTYTEKLAARFDAVQWEKEWSSESRNTRPFASVMPTKHEPTLSTIPDRSEKSQTEKSHGHQHPWTEDKTLDEQIYDWASI